MGFREASANETLTDGVFRINQSDPFCLHALMATGATDDEIATWFGKNAKKRPRTEIIAWNNQQRDMRLASGRG